MKPGKVTKCILYALQPKLIKSEDILGNTDTLRAVYWMSVSNDCRYIKHGQDIISFARPRELFEPLSSLTFLSDWVLQSRTYEFNELKRSPSLLRRHFVLSVTSHVKKPLWTTRV